MAGPLIHPFAMDTGQQSVSPNVPIEMQQQAAEIARKRAISEAMLGQALQPIQQQTVAQGRVVPVTAFEAISKALMGGMAGRQERSANEGSQQLAGQYTQGLARAVKAYNQRKTGVEGEVAPDASGAIEDALMSQYGPLRDYGKVEHAAEAARESERLKTHTVVPGGSISRDGKIIATAPGRPDPRPDKSIPADWQSLLPEGVKPGRSPGTYIGPDGDTVQVKYENGKPVDSHMVNPLPTNKNSDGTPLLPPVRLKPGERYKAGTNMQEVEAIPGSDLYIAQAQKHGKELGGLNLIDNASKNATDKIDYILLDKNKGAFNSNFGGYNAYATQLLPGATQDMKLKIQSLKSDMKKAGLDVIRSGGSIGQMTEREWPIVEQMIDSIDPRMSEGQAREVIGKVKVYIQKIQNSAKEVYDNEWSNTQFHRKTTTPDEEAAYQAWKAKQPKQ